MKLIHYGCKSFNLDLFKPIENKNWVKPTGGMQFSPIESEYGWKEWCESEDFRDCSEDNCLIVELKQDANIFIIDSLADLLKAPLYKPYTILSSKVIDFKRLAQNYDCIWLTNKGQIETRFSEPNLYGWDCESVLLMNPNCLIL